MVEEVEEVVVDQVDLVLGGSAGFDKRSGGGGGGGGNWTIDLIK